MKHEHVQQAAQELQLLHSSGEGVVFHGWSMIPTLVEGDQVILESVAFQEIRPGDIVTYRYRDKLPTRRVVSCRRNYLLLWCDNWPDMRFRSNYSDVLGRVTARIRDGERLEVDNAAWQKETTRAMQEYRASHAKYLLRQTRRFIGKHLLFHHVPPQHG